MPSYFNLTLKTSAPTGLAVLINSGAQFTTSSEVTLGISIDDAVTTGYQMKIWGTSTAALEANASWEDYATSKVVQLATGDGLKTIYVKVRDSVLNTTDAVSATITLDTTVPTVSMTGPDVTLISDEEGADTCTFSFTVDQNITAYEVRIVPAINSLVTAGVLIPMTNGSVHMSATEAIASGTTVTCSIKAADILAVSTAGEKIIKIFARDTSGNWSTV